MPKVSVVVPVFNQEKYIGECVDSILGQTYPDIEAIVVDDGSTDNTSSILRSYGEKIVYIRQENKGASAALNTGLRAARGEYIGWLSSDDIYLPNKIDEQMKFFGKHKDVSATYTDFYVTDGRGKVTREIVSPYFEDKRDFIFNMVRGNFINGSSVVFKRKCLEKVGYFDKSLKLHADGDMWFRMLKYFKFGHVPQLLLKYRWHETNASRDTVAMRRFLYRYYQKFLNLYSMEEVFKGGESDYRRELAEVFIWKRLYSMFLEQFFRSLLINPLNLDTYLLPLKYVGRHLSNFLR